MNLGDVVYGATKSKFRGSWGGWIGRQNIEQETAVLTSENLIVNVFSFLHDCSTTVSTCLLL